SRRAGVGARARARGVVLARGGKRDRLAPADGQANEERRAGAGPALEAEVAAVAIDDRRARQREALAGAAAGFFGGADRVERAAADRVGDPAAGVGDRDQDGAWVLELRADRDRAAPAAVLDDVADRVRGIDNQVEEHLVELADVAHHIGDVAELG